MTNGCGLMSRRHQAQSKHFHWLTTGFPRRSPRPFPPVLPLVSETERHVQGWAKEGGGEEPEICHESLRNKWRQANRGAAAETQLARALRGAVALVPQGLILLVLTPDCPIFRHLRMVTWTQIERGFFFFKTKPTNLPTNRQPTNTFHSTDASGFHSYAVLQKMLSISMTNSDGRAPARQQHEAECDHGGFLMAVCCFSLFLSGVFSSVKCPSVL